MSVGFSQAVLHCMPEDGGLYVPSETEDLRRWILYTDENTSFSSMAGSLTSAFIKDEFSPIICETIVTRAFPFSPEIRRLDENLFMLELFHGPTGMHRDFGISFLVSCFETILQLNGGKATFLDVSTGEFGASLACALRGKKNIRAVLVYPKETVAGLSESDFYWNGGNVYPVEVDGTEDDCHNLVRAVFAERQFAADSMLTVANTANIGRLLPQAFFYPFAFSRIKSKVSSSIFYALAPGNYSNVVAGLYAWQFALPLNGFILPATDALSVNPLGNPVLLDSVVPLSRRTAANMSEPSNIERLEDIFAANSRMMKHFLYPYAISDADVNAAAKELFIKYNVYADRHTARAYAASCMHNKLNSGEPYATVLVARASPSLAEEFVRHTVGEVPEMRRSIRDSLKPSVPGRPFVSTPEEIKRIITSLK